MNKPEETISINLKDRVWLNSLIIQYGCATKEHNTEYAADLLIKIHDILFPSN